jgi:hypothetical protein
MLVVDGKKLRELKIKQPFLLFLALFCRKVSPCSCTNFFFFFFSLLLFSFSSSTIVRIASDSISTHIFLNAFLNSLFYFTPSLSEHDKKLFFAGETTSLVKKFKIKSTHRKQMISLKISLKTFVEKVQIETKRAFSLPIITLKILFLAPRNSFIDCEEEVNVYFYLS